VFGLAKSHLPFIESYLDTIMKSSSESFPPELKYMGYSRLTPKEEYKVITKLKDNKHTYEMARSDLYMVKYDFNFNDKPLDKPRYIYLPFVTKGGLIHLGGTLYHISPVLTDRVITPNTSDIFVRLLRDKIIFNRLYHNVTVNNEKRPLQVIWANLYRNSDKKSATERVTATTRAVTCMVHHLLGKYGYTETFKKYLGFVPVVGELEINEQNYPPKDWVICKTTKVVPKGWRGSTYIPHNIRFAIKKENWNIFTENMMAGMFYVLDHFPEYVGLDMLDDTKLWLILLGHINYSGTYSMEKLYGSMHRHFMTLDNNIDEIIKENLKQSELVGKDIRIDNFYDLIALIIKNYSEWIIHSKEYNNNIYNRYLDVNYYIMYGLTSGIFTISHNIHDVLSSNKELTENKINNIFNANIPTKRIFNLIKSSQTNIAISVVDYSGDNMYPKITSIVALQENGTGVKRSKRVRLPESSKYLTGPDLALGSILFLTKKLPTPKVRVNPFANINPETGIINPPDEVKTALDLLNEMLAGKKPWEDNGER
jgi:hypothetical protein